MDNKMTEQESCAQRMLDCEDGPERQEQMKTVAGLIYWLEVIADCEDVEADTIVEVCRAAADRMRSLQHSLIQEVDRIETLQPFFTKVCAAVDAARKPST